MFHPYGLLFKTLLRHIDPERAHRLGLKVLRAAQGHRSGLALLGRHVPPADARLATTVFGLHFANPVGLAAGMDKDGEVVSALFALGFGHVEVGTVTPEPQPGNPAPRLWRLIAERALINALGFPSRGARSLRDHLEALDDSLDGRRGVLGINLGKNRETALDQAHEDYARLLRELFDLADYFTVNVSSPNTSGLRLLQLEENLRALLVAVLETNRQVAAAHKVGPKPVLLKISPDLADGEIPVLVRVAAEAGISGIVATNTTTERSGLAPPYDRLPGGLSGAPLRARSREVIRIVYREVGARCPIIGVGGVSTGEELLAHVRAGASLVQLYTGFVYGGPATAGSILRELSAAADRDGWRSLAELVGCEA